MHSFLERRVRRSFDPLWLRRRHRCLQLCCKSGRYYERAQRHTCNSAGCRRLRRFLCHPDEYWFYEQRGHGDQHRNLDHLHDYSYRYADYTIYAHSACPAAHATGSYAHTDCSTAAIGL
jgi:hypothetical protein